MGGSKLDPQGVECHLLGYADGNGNYKVQDVVTRRVFVSRDVIFEEGQPHRTSSSVGKNETESIPLSLFETNLNEPTLDDKKDPDGPVDQPSSTPISQTPILGNDVADPGDNANHRNVTDNAEAQQVPALRRSNRIPKPSRVGLQSKEYQQQEMASLGEEQDWTPAHASVATDNIPAERPEDITCLAEMKATHKIPHSYCHAMATDPDRWMVPMQIEMETLKSKHTWDLVKPPLGVNIMDSIRKMGMSFCTFFILFLSLCCLK
jgi:hypothetical protein